MVLFADIEVWAKLAVPLLILASWVFRTLYGDKKKPEPQRRAERRPVAPVRPAKPRNAADPKLNQEIEEFLRRAAQRRGAQTRRPTPAPPPQESELRLEVIPDPEPARLAPLGAGVAEHVQKHMATEEFGVRAAHLADDVVRSEQQLEQHVLKTLTHQVGRLADTSAEAEDKSAAAAAESKKQEFGADDLRSLVTNPASLRQAIVLREIFDRPEHRW